MKIVKNKNEIFLFFLQPTGIFLQSAFLYNINIIIVELF